MELAQNDRNIIVLTSDSRGSAGLTAFAEAFPDQFMRLGSLNRILLELLQDLRIAERNP
jgi:transketolase